MFLNQIGQYWNTRAQGYSNTINEQFEGEIYEYFNGYLRKCAPEGENIKCVDMGCGPGCFSILLSKMGYEVTAFDYSEGMLEKARENFAAKGVNPKIIDDIARELPLSKEYRPQWDVDQMLRLGMDNINVSVSRRRVNEDDASKCVVGDFVLCVEKPM